MRYDTVFFDFDGTLVDSAAAKKSAFFDLFPRTDRHSEVIEEVLNKDPDGSRFHVIPRIVEAMQNAKIEVAENNNVELLVQKYGQAALEAVSRAPEIPGASNLLKSLKVKNVELYLCSNTPQDAIERLVEMRGWSLYFDDIAGYPQSKKNFVHRHIHRKGNSPLSAAFVGDGASDQHAAQCNDVAFFAVEDRGDLRRVAANMDVDLDV